MQPELVTQSKLKWAVSLCLTISIQSLPSFPGFGRDRDIGPLPALQVITLSIHHCRQWPPLGHLTIIGLVLATAIIGARSAEALAIIGFARTSIIVGALLVLIVWVSAAIAPPSYACCKTTRHIRLDGPHAPCMLTWGWARIVFSRQ